MIFIRIILIKLKWKSLVEFINEIKRLEKVLQSLKGLKDDKEKVEYDEAKSDYDNIKLIIGELMFYEFLKLKI